MSKIKKTATIDSLMRYGKPELVEVLWGSDAQVYRILKHSKNLRQARNELFDYLNDLERHLFNVYSDKTFKNVAILEKNNAKECIRVFKNILRTENEKITGFSALECLYNLAKKIIDHTDLTEGFLFELIFLFKGINCQSGRYQEGERPLFLKLSGRKAAIERARMLDQYASEMKRFFGQYKTGLDQNLKTDREKNKRFILKSFGAANRDWQDYKWHIRNVIKDAVSLRKFIELSADELKGLACAEKYRIPFQITPYYLSLFDRENKGGYDWAIRAQVLPSENYCISYAQSRKDGGNLDFMDEKSTSPIEGITRRYPQILILKPFDSCPQICVYCQRNWEVTDIRLAVFSKETMANALKWIENNQNIREVLITGGDPLTLDDEIIDWLLGEIAGLKHIERIRIGTRVIVTMPQRITTHLLEIFGRYHKLGSRELCVVTHFEHPAEITPDSLGAIKGLKEIGINLYNQQVFTYYNSRRFESCLLRKTLKKCGIDPYYTFNTKGKDETIDYRVPIARIEQERKEEARLLPGLDRTDEPVFNVPRLGKSYLHAWQDHEVIMILPDGKRIYRFYPWESKCALVEPYNYTDVSIYDYLKRMDADGENVNDYSSIWYYF